MNVEGKRDEWGMRVGGDLGWRTEEVGAVQLNSRKNKRVTLQSARPTLFPYKNLWLRARVRAQDLRTYLQHFWDFAPKYRISQLKGSGVAVHVEEEKETTPVFYQFVTSSNLFCSLDTEKTFSMTRVLHMERGHRRIWTLIMALQAAGWKLKVGSNVAYCLRNSSTEKSAVLFLKKHISIPVNQKAAYAMCHVMTLSSL